MKFLSCCTEYYWQYRIYNKVKNFYFYESCDNNFCHKKSLNNHKITVIDKKKEIIKNSLENKIIIEYKCEKYEFKTINENVFNNHIKKYAKIKKIYSCEICEYQGTIKSHYERHSNT